MHAASTRQDPAISLTAEYHASCLLQMMIVTDPMLVTQALDRQLYPEYIDKPSLYSVINQVQASPAFSAAFCSSDSFRRGTCLCVSQRFVSVLHETL